MNHGRRTLERLSRYCPMMAATAGLLLSACQKPLSDAECTRLLERYVELLLRSDRPGVSPEEGVRLKAVARQKAAGDPAFAECRRRVSRSEFECAMRAENPDELEKCLL
ncbi:MAG TPA: hypothetical protein VGJ84_12355 [Polyangiaceae bacterium]|jgi:hypothetical protein